MTRNRSLALALLAGAASVAGPAAAQQAAPAYAVPAPQPGYYAPNLGINYTLVPYGASYGARLTANAAPGTPAGAIGLEAGDTITALDGQPINGPQDVLAHVAQTTVTFVNVRTGGAETRVTVLPGQPGVPTAPPGPFPPPGPGPGPGPLPNPNGTAYTLGVRSVPVAIGPAAPPGGYAATVVTGYGMQVSEVTPGGSASRAGIIQGDVMIAANGRYLNSHQALVGAIGQSNGQLNLTIRRGGADYTILVPLQAAAGGGVYAAPAAPR